MKLNRRYQRNIKTNLSFYMAAGTLTIVTLLLFYLFYMAGEGISAFGEKFFTEQKVEDANFTTYLPIPKEDMLKLAERFQVNLEEQQVLNISNEEGITVRVFSRTEKVNLYDVTEGTDLKKDTDIIISEGYALENTVAIGDKVEIRGKEFTVTGYFQRPDYLYMLQETSDSYKNITTFYLAYVTDEALEALGDSNITYLVRYQEDNSFAFRQAVNDSYYLQSYLEKDNNPRIAMVEEQAAIFVYMSYILLVIMPLVTVVLVCIILSRKVKDEQKIIGTLSAFGYSKGKIMMHYAGFAALPGVIGGILAYIFVTVLAQPYGELCLADYEPMRAVFALPLTVGVVGIIVPTFMYVLAALGAVGAMLKNDTVVMLSGLAGNKNKLKRAFMNSKISFRKKFAIRALLGNPARNFAVLLGIFLGSYMILLCFGFQDSIKEVAVWAGEDLGSFEYQYILNELQTELPEEGERLLVAGLENREGTTFTFMGITEENSYFELVDEQGVEVDLRKGFYLSHAAAICTGLQAGDMLEVYNPLSLEETEVEIQGVVACDTGMYVFADFQSLGEFIGMEDGVYNALISDKELVLEEGLVRNIIKKDAVREQADAMLQEMDVLIYSLAILGMIICVAAIYVAVNMMIVENRSNISMLKVLGYHDGAISSIVLNANHIFLPIGIGLSIPAVVWSIDAMFRMLLDFVGLLVTTHIEPKSYIYTVCLTAISYFGSIWLIRRKTKKVNMVEGLKDNRE